MSALNKILRGLLVLVVMLVLAFLVWKFASGAYLYPAIIAAALITIGVIFLAFRTFNSANRTEGKNSESSEIDSSANPDRETSSENTGNNDADEGPDSDSIKIQPDITDIAPRRRQMIQAQNTPFRSVRPLEKKPDGAEIAARYYKMQATEKAAKPQPVWGKAAVTPSPVVKPVDIPPVVEDEPKETQTADSSPLEDDNGEPPVPLIEDASSLTEDDKNVLVNAVWYRCENPYCKYTRFLTVHHIQEEKDGGTNRLDNLIVLCPFCHDLAHRHEIPEEEMRSWISNREERFKFKPDWRYV